MVKHKKIYLNYFDYGEQDFIPCENCSNRAVDIHHIIFRSHGGTDTIDNLMALCRECHDKAHNSYVFNAELYRKHRMKYQTWKACTGKNL